MTGTQLLKTEQIQLLLEDLEARNAVIRELSLIDEPHRMTLAFWLGNSVLLSRLLTLNVNESELIRGYLCFLALDKKIGLLEQINARQKTIASLRHCQLEFLLYFNEHYSLFYENPEAFFDELREIIQTIDLKSVSAASEKKLLIDAQSECLSLLDSTRVYNSELEVGTKPRFSSLITLRPHLTEYIVRRISRNYNARLFVSEQLSPAYSLSVQFIQGKKGIILEGLLIEDGVDITDTIVLAQIARSPFQSLYFQNSFSKFAAFFGTKVFLLNHRNYSSRSAVNAQSIYDLAQDVFDTALHFYKQKQRIVLYGMCGGVPHTLLAACLLKRNNIPFKLIVDRFATDYSAFRSSKTLMRQTCLAYVQQPELLRASEMELLQVQLYLFMQVIYGLLIYLILGMTRTNINGAQLIRVLSAEDVLILQARAPKESPEFVDSLIHPAYEMRGAVKDRRYGIKAVFKNLIEECNKISALLAGDDSLQELFRDFSVCFSLFLQLLSDEKLTISSSLPSQNVHDLHGAHLYQLETRSNLPLQHFVQGFFAAPKKNCMSQLNQLHSFSKEDILCALKKIYRNDGLNELAHHISSFLSELVLHKLLIGHYANRAFTTNQIDIAKPLQHLLDSSLYTELGLINSLRVTL